MWRSIVVGGPVIRELRGSDLPEWVRLRAALWPDADPAELEKQCRDFLAGVRTAALPRAVFVYDRGDGRLGAFQEVSIRGAAEGCATDRVAYLEGLLVERDLRRQGIARKLVEAAEQWARAQGCAEIASDVLAGNHVSQKMHLRLGYGPVRPLVHFRKPLGPVKPAAVHVAVVCEPIDPAAVVSLAHDRWARSVRLATALVEPETSDGRHLAAIEVVDTPATAGQLEASAREFLQRHKLRRLATILRCGEVSVGEAWAAVAVSAETGQAARDAAETFLAQLDASGIVQRRRLWRGVPISP
ncbi:MAG: GNAT family N-acetyltransferase [Tepidisphaerales bacterium]